MKSWLPPLLVAALALVLMVTSSWDDSPCYDEPEHITAGYTYVRTGWFWMNPFHPPLVKTLSGLCVGAQTWRDPWRAWARLEKEPSINDFFYREGNDPQAIVHAARAPVMLLSAGFLLLYWSALRRALGPAPALLAMVLLAFSPTYLAHGRFVTTDVPAAAACFLCLAVLFGPERWRGPKLGLACGTALLVKFSTVLMPPFCLVVLAWRRAWRECLWLVVLAPLTLYAGYNVLPVQAEYQIWYDTIIFRKVPNDPVVRAIRSTEPHDVLRPWAWYATGLYAQTRHLVFGREGDSYLRHKRYKGGRWDYFPTLLVCKEPLGSLILASLGLALALRRRDKPPLVVGLVAFSLLYLAIAMPANLNLGIRHVLPIVPALYAVAAWGVVASGVPRALPVLCVTATAASVLAAWPGFLAYFNEAAGGKANGPRLALDSNFDWGTDLQRLRLQLDRSGRDHLALLYWGRNDPRAYLGSRFRPLGREKLARGEVLAVSANYLVQAELALEQGTAPPCDLPPEMLRWLVSLPEVGRAGDSLVLLSVP